MRRHIHIWDDFILRYIYVSIHCCGLSRGNLFKSISMYETNPNLIFRCSKKAANIIDTKCIGIQNLHKTISDSEKYFHIITLVKLIDMVNSSKL